MTKFEQAELKCRELFKEVLESLNINTWNPTTDMYNRVDGYFTKDDKQAVVEIKGRTKYYEQFDTHLMEVDKYKAIVKDAQSKGIKCAYYACFFGDNTLYLYNVGIIKNNSDVEQKWCPKTTAENSDYCWKPCYMIHKEIAQVFNKVNGKWIKQEN